MSWRWPKSTIFGDKTLSGLNPKDFSATDKNKHKIVNKNKSEKKKTEIEFKFQDRSRHSVQDAIAKI